MQDVTYFPLLFYNHRTVAQHFWGGVITGSYTGDGEPGTVETETEMEMRKAEGKCASNGANFMSGGELVQRLTELCRVCPG